MNVPATLSRAIDIGISEKDAIEMITNYDNLLKSSKKETGAQRFTQMLRIQGFEILNSSPSIRSDLKTANIDFIAENKHLVHHLAYGVAELLKEQNKWAVQIMPKPAGESLTYRIIGANIPSNIIKYNIELDFAGVILNKYLSNDLCVRKGPVENKINVYRNRHVKPVMLLLDKKGFVNIQNTSTKNIASITFSSNNELILRNLASGLDKSTYDFESPWDLYVNGTNPQNNNMTYSLKSYTDNAFSAMSDLSFVLDEYYKKVGKTPKINPDLSSTGEYKTYVDRNNILPRKYPTPRR